MDKVILAYSGGLDTSVAIHWLQEKYNLDVICFSAFIGEVPDAEKLRKKAIATGASKAYIHDLKNEFAKDFILPALWAHARYEGKYPLATSLGRPLIAKHLVRIARQEKAKYVAHGCTGKGNDQVRLELGIRGLAPDLKIIAPLREWDMGSREEEIEYAKKHKIPITVSKEKVYSIDKNIWGIAIEGGPLEDPMAAPPEDAYQMTRGWQKKKKGRDLTLTFVKGVPTAIDGVKMALVPLIEKLNEIAGSYGVGRIDMIENRLVGIKSREVYEAPAASLLIEAHEELEAMVLDREHLHYKRLLSEKYSEMVYYGLWFTPLKRALDHFFAADKDQVTGSVRFRLEPGFARVTGRDAKKSLYSEALATYSTHDKFDHKSAEGFLKLWGLPYEGRGTNV